MQKIIASKTTLFFMCSLILLGACSRPIGIEGRLDTGDDILSGDSISGVLEGKFMSRSTKDALLRMQERAVELPTKPRPCPNFLKHDEKDCVVNSDRTALIFKMNHCLAAYNKRTDTKTVVESGNLMFKFSHPGVTCGTIDAGLNGAFEKFWVDRDNFEKVPVVAKAELTITSGTNSVKVFADHTMPMERYDDSDGVNLTGSGARLGGEQVKLDTRGRESEIQFARRRHNEDGLNSIDETSYTIQPIQITYDSAIRGAGKMEISAQSTSQDNIARTRSVSTYQEVVYDLDKETDNCPISGSIEINKYKNITKLIQYLAEKHIITFHAPATDGTNANATITVKKFKIDGTLKSEKVKERNLLDLGSDHHVSGFCNIGRYTKYNTPLLTVLD